MMTGTYQLYLAKTMLALFSDEAFALPSEELELDGTDLRAHLTNTCLQVSLAPSLTKRMSSLYEFQNADDSGPPEHLVKLFWELEGQTILSSDESDQPKKIDRQWLDLVFEGAGNVIAETVKAAAECGSFGLQLMPNAFEVCTDRSLVFRYSSELISCRLVRYSGWIFYCRSILQIRNRRLSSRC